MTPQRLGDVLGRELALLADRDPRIHVLDGDLADSDGAVHFAERHPARFLMAGIAEQNMVSVAAGMASCGARPFVFSFAAFLCYRAFDQIRVCVSQARQPVTLIGSHSGGFSGRNGKTHAAMSDLAVMLSLPGVAVWAPADFPDVSYTLARVLADGAPAYVRLPRRPIGEDERLPGAPAGHRFIGERQPAVLVSTGAATHLAVAAQRRLAERGTRVAVLHCPEVTAVASSSSVAGALSEATQLFVIEDHYPFGGVASAVRRLGLAAPVTEIGWPQSWPGKSGSDEDLVRELGFSATAIADTVVAKLARLAG